MKRLSHKNAFTILLILIVSFAVLVAFMSNIYRQSRAAEEVTISADDVTSRSGVFESGKTLRFLLESQPEDNLIETKEKGRAAAFEVLSKRIRFNNVQRLIPEDVAQNTRLAREYNDAEDPFLKKYGFNLSNKHYIYKQLINDIPVLGATLTVHLKNEDEVYRMNASLINTESVPKPGISDEQAKQRALDRAKEEVENPDGVSVGESTLTVVNEKLLGISQDDSNHIALGVTTIAKSGEFIDYAKTIYVDLVSGEIIYEVPHFFDAINRQIADCSTSYPNCRIRRIEGGAPSGIRDVDSAYDYVGETYSYFKNSYNRDSFDNQGRQLSVFVGVPQVYNAPCPNAGLIYETATKSNIQMQFCPGLMVKDVTAHEYMHGVTLFTADLFSADQSGVLNESISDVFAHAVDSDDWSFGEESSIGAFRHMDDPTRPRSTTHPSVPSSSPDRLFSQHYYCGTNQSAYVHLNTGVFNKAFYLMTAGGNFNGCTITAQTKEKTLPIVYRALTAYLTQTSNFRAMYDAMLQSCSDLYGQNSDTCQNVMTALQATEMDQQPQSFARGPACQGISPVRPSCASTVNPTSVPPTGVQPTLPPTNIPVQSPVPSPIVTGTYTSPNPAGTVTLNLKLRFQGILATPQSTNSMNVGVNIASPDLGSPVGGVARFTPNSDGTWSGKISFIGLPEGSNYRILIKGPMHLQKKLCVARPVETFPGTYRCGEGNITIGPGENNLDFSGVYQMAGDLPVYGDQDGIINAIDLVSIIITLGSTNPEDLAMADINLDGVIDTQDFSLVINTLYKKFDEE